MTWPPMPSMNLGSLLGAGAAGATFGGGFKLRPGDSAALERGGQALREMAREAYAKREMRKAAYGLLPQRGAPRGVDPSSASILHVTQPDERELAIIFAEHARWAQRETLKALSIAAADTATATEAASRANVAALEALRQPGASFPVMAHKPVTGGPWDASPPSVSGRSAHGTGATRPLWPMRPLAAGARGAPPAPATLPMRLQAGSWFAFLAAVAPVPAAAAVAPQPVAPALRVEPPRGRRMAALFLAGQHEDSTCLQGTSRG